MGPSQPLSPAKPLHAPRVTKRNTPLRSQPRREVNVSERGMYQNHPFANAAQKIFPAFGEGNLAPLLKYPNTAMFLKT